MRISEAVSSQSPAKNTAGYASQDFDTFLKMLTTQIQNQDPLSPLNADDFSNQLATFSLVEQQTLTNQNLEQLIQKQEMLALLDYASLVGRSVVHTGGFEFTGDPVSFEIEIPSAEGNTLISIRDAQGRPVSELLVPVGESAVTWDGTGINGQFVLSGAYSAEVVRQSDGTIVEGAVSTASTVQEVQIGQDGVSLKLSDGSVIPYHQITKVR